MTTFIHPEDRFDAAALAIQTVEAKLQPLPEGVTVEMFAGLPRHRYSDVLQMDDIREQDRVHAVIDRHDRVARAKALLAKARDYWKRNTSCGSAQVVRAMALSAIDIVQDSVHCSVTVW